MTKYHLALDPSKASTGWAVISSEGGDAKFVDGGYIDTRHADNPLRVIYQELLRIINLYPIEKTISKEALFYRNNIATLMLAKVHGVIELLHGYDLIDVSSSTVRKVIGGHGHADKEMVAAGVRRILQLPPDFIFPRSDVSDAASIALTYLYQASVLPLSA